LSAYLQHLFADIGLWTAIGVTLVAGLMRGFAGFGSAMLMAPIFAILFGSAEMVVTVVAIELIVSLQLFPQVRSHADWKTLMPMSIAAGEERIVPRPWHVRRRIGVVTPPFAARPRPA
jgi:hypothetical protein